MNKSDREAFLNRGRVATLEPEPPPFTPVDIQNYQAAGQHIAKSHPELVGGQVAQEMTEAGFEMHPVVTATIIKHAKPEVTAWLLSPEGREDAHALNNVKDNKERSLRELERIESRVERQGIFSRPVERRDEVANYLEQRREDIRSGKRRRR